MQQISDPNQAPLQDILTPLDEVNFWTELATNASLSGPAIKAAQQVHMYLEPLRPSLEQMVQGTLEGSWEAVKEVIDQIINALRQVCVPSCPPQLIEIYMKKVCALIAITSIVAIIRMLPAIVCYD